jgi:hypothetical protein
MPEDRRGDGPVLWDPLGAWPAGRRWLWPALAVVVGCLQGPNFIETLRPPPEAADFFQEWASARNVFRGAAVYTEHAEAVRLYLKHDVPKEPGPYIRFNAHPPTSVLLALPFAALGYSDATLAWNLASLAAFGASLWLLVRGLGIATAKWGVFPAAALLLTCSPVRQQVNLAQLNMVLLLVTGVWAAERSGRPRLAGALLGAATAVKLFPGFLFLFFLLRRRWSVVLVGVVSLAALTGATALILGTDAYRDYVRVVLPEVSRFRSGWFNASLAGFWEKVLGEGAWHYDRHILPVVNAPRLARTGTLLARVGVLVLWARAVWRARTPAEGDHAFGLSLIAMMLLSPITWDHYFVILALPSIQLWIGLPHSNTGNTLRLGLLACLWAEKGTLWRIFLPDSLFLAGSISAPVTLVTLLSYQCYTLLALFALGLVYPGDGSGPTPGGATPRTVGDSSSATVTASASRLLLRCKRTLTAG